jgi:hypothetical protein
MPLYFFHLHGSNADNVEGQEFSGDETARQEAKAVARDLGRNRIGVSAERVIVRNAEGKTVHAEPLS